MADQPQRGGETGQGVSLGEAAILLQGVSKVYGDSHRPVTALDEIDLEIGRREFVVVLGPSGSGKTTLLNAIGGIDPPTSGSVQVDGERVEQLPADRRAVFRRAHVGFVFQFFNLIPTLTASENVQLVAELRDELGDPARRTERVLEDVGLEDQAASYPGQLSGGQQQRVAIARALVNQAAVLLCDEPTGSLDLETGRAILALLRRARDEREATVLLVTHNSAIARAADRVLRMRSGRIVDDERVSDPIPPEDVTW